MPRVIHFEIHAENPERAVDFYKKVFGWSFQKWGGPMDYYLVTTGEAGQPGINGGLMRRQGPPPADGQPVNAYVCTIDVPNIDEFSSKALAAGARVALPKMPVPGIGWLAYFKDTEGNIFGMIQNDPNAK
jgi:predicted enzyme related to lactoylglutathione lyase